MHRMHSMITGLISLIFNSTWTEPTEVKSLVGEQKLLTTCLHSFFSAWRLFKTCFHQKSPSTHNNLLHSPIFDNPWILRRPEVADSFTYKRKENRDHHINPLDYGLSRTEFRHLKVLDLLDENGVKSLDNLKDELGLLKLHFLSYARLVRVLSNMEKVYPVGWVKNMKNHILIWLRCFLL